MAPFLLGSRVLAPKPLKLMLFVLLLDPLWVTVIITTSIGLELKLHNDDDLLDQEELLKTMKKQLVWWKHH
jgi:hypothetical protein